MKIIFAVALLCAALAVPGAAAEGRVSCGDADLRQDVRFTWLLRAVETSCAIPADLHAQSRGYLGLYVSQVYCPANKMLSTAFLRGFTSSDSRRLPLGYCVGAFLGIPTDPGWEPSLNLVRSAREAGTLPAMRLKAVSQEGDLTFGAF